MNLPHRALLKNRIGILGGTFDPIHNGHINCAKHIANYLSLDDIRLLPCHIPPHKSQTSATSSQRKKMVELACNNEALLSVDARELTKASTSYTIETLLNYQQELPETTLYFIIGMDSLNTFTQWSRWQKILTLCHIVVCTRPGYQPEFSRDQQSEVLAPFITKDIEQTLVKKSGCILLTPEDNTDISSTQIRQLQQNQQAIEHLVPACVAKYIKKEQLYR